MDGISIDQLKSLFSELKDTVPLPSAIEAHSDNTDQKTCESVTLGGKKHKVYYFKQLSDTNTGWLLSMPAAAPPPFVVTDSIKQEGADRLKNANIPFIDNRGNAFINLPGLYVFIVGRNQGRSSFTPTKRGGKLFQYSGVKLIYAFLTDPLLDEAPEKALLNCTVRTIAKKAHVSMGSVSELFREMKDRGYLSEEANGSRQRRWLLNREELFAKWVHGYCEYRPRKNVIRLQADTPNWWQEIDIEEYRAQWGGEAAAVLLADGFLINPQVISIYTHELMGAFVLKANLQKVESGGNVEIMAPFHGFSWKHHPSCVHPLLVYGDLIYSADSRNREAAKRVYDKHLHSIIQPDR